MKFKPQASRKGRLTAFYESREYLSDEDVREERYMERTHEDERLNRRNQRQQRKRRESRRRHHREDSDTIISSSLELFNLGSAALGIAIDMVLTAFDPCGALQDILPPNPHREDIQSRRHGNIPSEEIHLDRTLTVKGCEDATLISGLTDVFPSHHDRTGTP